LEAVLEEMVNIHANTTKEHEGGLGSVCEDLMEAAIRQRDTLRKEVDKYCAERGVQRG
jgi:indoleamine 2,3-dioxygenase